MEPLTNEEITALLYDAMPTARALMERKSGETLAVVQREKATTLAAFPDAMPTAFPDAMPTAFPDAMPTAFPDASLSDEILTAPAGSGE
jgi:hypothetical protein